MLEAAIREQLAQDGAAAAIAAQLIGKAAEGDLRAIDMLVKLLCGGDLPSWVRVELAPSVREYAE